MYLIYFPIPKNMIDPMFQNAAMEMQPPWLAFSDSAVSAAKDDEQIQGYKLFWGQMIHSVLTPENREKYIEKYPPPHGDMIWYTEYKNIIAEREKAVREANIDLSDIYLEPPFTEFPDYSPIDLGWRMGWGEYYIHAWKEWFSLLSEPQKKVYISKFPAPAYWPDFYATPNKKLNTDEMKRNEFSLKWKILKKEYPFEKLRPGL